MNGLRQLLRHPVVGSVTKVFLVAFLAVFVPGSVGWLHLLTEWSRSAGQAPFPDARSLAFIGVSAIVAGLVAALHLVVELAQKWLAGQPQPPEPSLRLPVEVTVKDARTGEPLFQFSDPARPVSGLDLQSPKE